MDFIYLPFVTFIAVPFLALIPAGLFLILLRYRRSKLSCRSRTWVQLTVIAWLAYAAYESAMWLWSRDVIAPIRVDLLVIAPLLYLLSLAALVAVWRRGSDV